MFFAILLACTGKPGDSASADDTATVTDPDTLSAIQAETFTPSCAFASCHAATNPAGSLDLTDGHTFASLVGVEAADAPGQTLVIAGDSANSYLVAKLSGDPDIVGDPMPSGSDGLDATRLAHIIDWIDAGAADN